MAYPVMLNVKGRRCLVVGGGQVGARKARGLHAEGAVVTVLSSSFLERLDGVTYINARYDRQYIEQVDPWLVVTCVNSGETNAQIGADADEYGAIVIRADDSKAGDAHGVMKREQGEVTLMAASGVPTFSRFLLDTFEAQLTPELVAMGETLKDIRAELRESLPTAEARTAAWQRITPQFAGWVERLNAGETVNIRAEVEALLAND
jgi:siroheme synthase-like protein